MKVHLKKNDLIVINAIRSFFLDLARFVALAMKVAIVFFYFEKYQNKKTKNKLNLFVQFVKQKKKFQEKLLRCLMKQINMV